MIKISFSFVAQISKLPLFLLQFVIPKRKVFLNFYSETVCEVSLDSIWIVLKMLFYILLLVSFSIIIFRYGRIMMDLRS